MNIIGSDIRLRREELGVSLRKFASEVGISPTYLSQVETGAQHPSIDILKSIYSLFPDNEEKIEINNIIKNHPELLLVIQLFSDVNKIKDLQYARYVAIIYVTSLYIASLRYGIALKPGRAFKVDDGLVHKPNLSHEPDRASILGQVYQQFSYEIRLTAGLRQFDIHRPRGDYKDEIVDLVNSGQLTIAEIAAKSQVTENYIKQVLNGNRNPSIKIKQRLIESLGLEVATPKTYGIPNEYANSQLINRIVNTTNNIRQLPNIPANKVIEFAAEFTTRNITIDIVKKWDSFPDLECAELVIRCFAEIVGLLGKDNVVYLSSK